MSIMTKQWNSTLLLLLCLNIIMTLPPQMIEAWVPVRTKNNVRFVNVCDCHTILHPLLLSAVSSKRTRLLARQAISDDGTREDEGDFTYSFYEDEAKTASLSQSHANASSRATSGRSTESSTNTAAEGLGEVSDMNGLNEHLKRLRQSRPQKDSVTDRESRKQSKDPVVAEWEELEHHIDQERSYRRDISEDDDNRGPLPPIIEANMEKSWEEKRVLDTLSSGRGIVFDSLQDIPSISGSGVNYNEANLPPGARPSRYEKKYISDFEFTEDGHVQLSSEAYRAACDSATNPDGSLNFANKDGTAVPTASESIFSPSVLETVTARPMAPYDQESLLSQKQPHGKTQELQKELTIQDLINQARMARIKAEQDPEAGEKLHHRIMAEEAALDGNNDSPMSKLFQEALMNPEKAWEFWNKEYLETKQRETEELERVLDERMKMLEEMSAAMQQEEKKEERSDKSTYDAFFETAEQGKGFQRRPEEEKKLFARNLELFYSEPGDDRYGREMKKETKVQEIILEADGFDKQRRNMKQKGIANVQKEDQGEWVLVEDPTTSDEPFYWNSVTEEMRFDVQMNDDNNQ
jgi:hypothetical protein